MDNNRAGYAFSTIRYNPSTSSLNIRTLIHFLVMDIVLPLTVILAKPFNCLQSVQFDAIPRLGGLSPIGLILRTRITP